MKFNSWQRNVQSNSRIMYSGVQELKNIEQGLQFYSRDLVKKMKKGLKIEKNNRVLDFGAGTDS